MSKISDSYRSRPIFFLAAFSLLFFCLSAFLPKQNIYFPLFNFLNVDSSSWLRAAYNFPYNLDIWTSRPLYPFLIFIFSRIIKLSGISFIINQFFGFKFLYFIDNYLASLFVNFILYFSSSVFFYKALEKAGEKQITCLSGALLYLGSLITLTWTGQPLPQFFDYFLSAFVFYSLVIAGNVKTEDLSLKYMLVASIPIGLLFLAKTALWAFVFGISYLITRRKLISAAIFGSISISMILIWRLLILFLFKMPWIDHGIQNYRFGIWIIDAIKNHDMGIIINVLNKSLLNIITHSIYAFLFPISFLLVILLINKKIIFPRISFAVFGLFVLSIFIMASAMKGMIPPRLAFNLFPFVFWTVAINITIFFQRIFHNKSEKFQLIFLFILAILNLTLVPFLSFS